MDDGLVSALARAQCLLMQCRCCLAIVDTRAGGLGPLAVKATGPSYLLYGRPSDAMQGGLLLQQPEETPVWYVYVCGMESHQALASRSIVQRQWQLISIGFVSSCSGKTDRLMKSSACNAQPARVWPAFMPLRSMEPMYVPKSR
jgi:hypothetical protein